MKIVTAAEMRSIDRASSEHFGVPYTQENHEILVAALAEAMPGIPIEEIE